MHTEVGTEPVSLGSSSTLGGPRICFRDGWAHSTCEPSALSGMLALLCREQLPCPSGLHSPMGTLLVNCLSPPSPGLHGPLSRWAWVGEKGDLCLPGGHCVEHGVVGDMGTTTPLLCSARASPCSRVGFGTWGYAPLSLLTPIRLTASDVFPSTVPHHRLSPLAGRL